MRFLAMIFVTAVALLHFGFLTLEMFLWDHPIGREVFSMTEAQSAATKQLAANQGLYNGFLAVGLLWGQLTRQREVVLFFLLCVMVAGVFGAYTAKLSILYIQAAPALAAFVATLMSRRRFV